MTLFIRSSKPNSFVFYTLKLYLEKSKVIPTFNASLNGGRP